MSDFFIQPQFDTAVSLKTTEFKDIREFYAQRSSGSVVHRVQIPTLIINSRDDPVVDAESAWPHKAISENPNLFGILTERGGHLGFMDRGLAERTWDERVATQWLELLPQDEEPRRFRLEMTKE